MNIFNGPLSSYSALSDAYRANRPNHISIENMFDHEFINKLEKEFDRRLEDKNNWKDPNRGFLERQLQLEEANEFQNTAKFGHRYRD